MFSHPLAIRHRDRFSQKSNTASYYLPHQHRPVQHSFVHLWSRQHKWARSFYKVGILFRAVCVRCTEVRVCVERVQKGILKDDFTCAPLTCCSKWLPQQQSQVFLFVFTVFCHHFAQSSLLLWCMRSPSFLASLTFLVISCFYMWEVVTTGVTQEWCL